MLNKTDATCPRSHGWGRDKIGTQANVSGSSGFQRCLGRPTGHCQRIQIPNWSPGIHLEKLPRPRISPTSGEQTVQSGLTKAPGTVIWGHDTLKVTSFIVASGGGRVEAAGQTGGARKLGSRAQDKDPTAGLPRQALVLANKSTTASLINLWSGVQ